MKDITSVEDILKELTLEEKCSLLSGESFWYSQSIEEKGIEKMMFTDGPHGLRKQNDKADHLGMNKSVPATCFPPACALGASWNENLIYEMGEALGIECRAEDVAVLLGPGVNIKRSPLCGRNFEYFSEDPYLSSHLAKQHIRGVQSKGVGTSVKHFIANNQETKRLTLNAVVDERTLREIYFASFETAIREGNPWTVMCAYNQLNGHFGSEHKYVLNDVLRDEWKYDGLVVTDWGATNDRVEGLIAGQDLEMPSSGDVNDRKVQKAVEDGILSEEYVDRAVRRFLKLSQKVHERKKVEAFDKEKHHALAKRIASECIVLLKNEDKILPLNLTEKIGVVGEFAVKARLQGGGSSHINPTFTDCILDEMRKTGGELVSFAKGFAMDQDCLDENMVKEAIQLAKESDKLVVCMGLPESYETEGLDRTHLNLPEIQLEFLEKILPYNENIIVVLNNGAPVVMPFENKVKGIVEGYLLGQAGGAAVAEMLYGVTNPSGKLAETFPQRLEDTPSFLNFPGEGYKVEYREGIFVGYRHYDTKKIKPQFCFGYGLSYTDFSYDSIHVDKKKADDQEKITVTAEITNIGNRTGKEIVQLYVHDRQTAVTRPEKELKGFCKLELEPGQTGKAVFELDKRSFAYYDVEQKDFLVQTGDFDILVGASSQDIRLQEQVYVKSTTVIHKQFHKNSTFGEIYEYLPTREIAEEMMDYFKRESGIDFELGDNVEDFAFRVICDFPLKTLVTFTKGKYSEAQLDELIHKLNHVN